MFLYVWLLGLVKIICWQFGWMVGGTAPSFKTSYWAYGWFGWDKYFDKPEVAPEGEIEIRKEFFEDLAAAIDDFETKSEMILGVYVHLGDELYSWNGEALIHAGKADDLLKEQ